LTERRPEDAIFGAVQVLQMYYKVVFYAKKAFERY